MKKRKKQEINWTTEVLTPLLMLVGLMIYFNVIEKKWLYIILGSSLAFLALAISYSMHRKRKLRRSGIDSIDKMSGEQFEKYLKLFFEEQGYKVKLTPVTADYGCDLLLKKNGETITVQAKRYTDKVGIKAVQEVIGSIKHYKADRAMVLTNSYFTQNAIELARSNEVELWDRNDLINRILYIAQKKSKTTDVESEQESCPRCGKELVKRNGKNGQFIGCSGFPKCRYTKNIENSH